MKFNNGNLAKNEFSLTFQECTSFLVFERHLSF